MDWQQILKEAIVLFAIIDPIGAVGIFLSYTHAQTAIERRRTALITAVTVAIVLIAAILVGETIMGYFGIRLASFQVGGGLVILMMSFSMLNARMPGFKRTAEEAREAEDKVAVAVVPLAIPLLAGPASITTVILAAHTATGAAHIAVLSGVVVAISFFTWASFRLSEKIASMLGKTGLNIITRLMGLLLAAISIEIIANGLIGLFPVLAGQLK